MSATQSSTILSAFNDHFIEFVNDIVTVFPEDPDILSAKNSFILIRKANPKMIIKIWQSYVINKYGAEIEKGNIDFFINKDYGDDLTNTGNSDKIVEAIDRLRNPVKMMNTEERTKVMKYMQNLQKLSTLYHNLA
jgi:hypothetical protein